MIVRFIAYNIYGMGGTVRTVVNTANYLVENGYKVEIISLRKTSEKPLFNINKNIKITPLMDITKSRRTLSPKKEFLYKKLCKIPSFLFDKNEDLYSMLNLLIDVKLYRKLKKIKHGVLVTTIPSLNVMSVKYVHNNVIKIGQEHRTLDVHKKSIQKKIKKYYHKLDAITCLTDKDVDNYKKVITNSNILIEKIENATDIQYQSSNLSNKEIISAGRFSEEKGFDLLIRAFDKAVKKAKDKHWKLKIYGNGALKNSYIKLINELGCQEKITISPTSKTLVDDIKESSIYALASRSESFGMVLIESMSVGVPCVSFACEGPKEVIRHEEDGILVENENIDKFAEGLVALMDNYDERKRLGENAKINSQRYSMDKIGEKWTKLINRLEKTKRNKR